MTEPEWLTCAEPAPMLAFLRDEMRFGRSPRGRRKLRLLACGYCRQIWELIEDERSRRLLEISELWADGLAATQELAEAEVATKSAKVTADMNSAAHPSKSRIRRVAAAIGTPLHTARKDVYEAARLASHSALCAVGGYWCIDIPNPEWDTQAKQQVMLLRDIFGNPFRPSPPLPASILTWNDRTIPRIAQAIYDERQLPQGTLDAGRLAILADALLDAGCEDEALLAHFRSEGPHVRGCHGIDLILGKS